VICRS
ncbi:hypothetical protein MIMGU_mgv1a0126792mg, partial [Erythranthe guttata]